MESGNGGWTGWGVAKCKDSLERGECVAVVGVEGGNSVSSLERGDCEVEVCVEGGISLSSLRRGESVAVVGVEVVLV